MNIFHMDYLDLMQFDLGTNVSKNIPVGINWKPVVDVHVYVKRGSNCIDLYIKTKNPQKTKRWHKGWKNITPIAYLPHLKVSHLHICNIISIDFINELLKTFQFIKSEVELTCGYSMPVSIFTKLSETFTPKKFDHFASDIDHEFFSLPSFLEIDFLKSHIDGVPDTKLSKVKSKKMVFLDYTDLRISVTANVFFRQWLGKEREIHWFYAQNSEEFLKKKSIMRGLPFSTIFRQTAKDSGRVKLRFLKEEEELFKEDLCSYKLYDQDCIYSVDRGDKKLLIFIGGGFVMAAEYIRLHETIQINMGRKKMLRDEQRPFVEFL